MRLLLLALCCGFIGLQVAIPAGADDLSVARARLDKLTNELAAAQQAVAESEQAVSAASARLKSIQTQHAQVIERVKAEALRRYTGETFTILDFDIADVARASAIQDVVSGRASRVEEQYGAIADDLALELAGLEKAQSHSKEAAANLEEKKASAQAELQRIAELERQKAEAAAAQAAKAAQAANAAQAAQKTAAKASGAANSPKKAAAPTANDRAAIVGAQTGVIASGSWVCPVQGTRSFTNDWGAPRPGGNSHQGTDILSPLGTPVVANVSGTVNQHPNGRGGLAYYLKGDDGNTYYGAHLSSWGASGRVSAGTVIGYVGNTGDASGGPTHLHFEIHPGGGGAVNPYPTLSQHC